MAFGSSIKPPLYALHSPPHSKVRQVYSCHFRVGDLHVSRLSREKHKIPGRAQESAQHGVIRTFPSAAVASRLVVPALAEPDIHLLSKTPKSPHRRWSLCSLPVPKQFGESLRSVTSIAQSPTGGTWQPAHRRILMFLFFHYWKRFFTLPPYT
jgi:hypothetical protein